MKKEFEIYKLKENEEIIMLERIVGRYVFVEKNKMYIEKVENGYRVCVVTTHHLKYFNTIRKNERNDKIAL